MSQLGQSRRFGQRPATPSTPNSGHRQAGPVGPVRVNNGHRVEVGGGDLNVGHIIG